MAVGDTIYRAVKTRAATMRRGRSLYLAAVCVRDAIRYRAEGSFEHYETTFRSTRDPYGYEREPYETERFASSTALLDVVRGGRRFSRALEVGCHEGAFTERLVERCSRIVATDQSPVMVSRTTERARRWPNVEVRRWNLATEPAPGTFDLVVLMDVLECIHRPSVLRAVRDKVVDAMDPGGYLLVTNSTVNEDLEKARWARMFLRGGRRINDFVARHRQLRVLDDIDVGKHAVTILQKRPS